MAAIEHIQGGVHAGNGLRAKISAFFAGIQEARARNAVYRQTVRELKSLTARDLDDLGIHHSMITRIAHEAAYGPAK